MNRVDVPMTEARANLADLVNRVAYTGEPVALTRRGRVMAAIVSAEDLELLRRLREAPLEMTPAEPPGQERARPVRRPGPGGPMPIAAEYRPGGPPRPPGFAR